IDEPLCLRPRGVDLGLAVRHQELEPRAAQRLDPAGVVDGLHCYLGAEPRILAHVGHGAGERLHHADLDRAGLSAEHGGEGAHADGRDRRAAKEAPSIEPNRIHGVSSLSGGDHDLPVWPAARVAHGSAPRLPRAASRPQRARATQITPAATMPAPTRRWPSWPSLSRMLPTSAEITMETSRPATT